jgi:hypothetical protein
MKDRYILEALQKGAIAAVAASTNPSLPIKVVGRTFQIPDDQKYLELVFIPGDNPRESWGKDETKQGIFRLILHWPINDAGAYAPLDVLASVVGYFDKDVPLQSGPVTVKIYMNPTGFGVVENEKENLYPASIFYRASIS